MKGSNENILNKKKIIYIPLLVGFITILTVSIVTFYISKLVFYKQTEEDAINFANLLSQKIESELDHLESINIDVEEKILLTGNLIIKNKDNLSNEYLKEISELVGMDKLYWYNSQGEILFSATNEYIGTKAKKGDPVYNFMESNQRVFIEDIRKSTETDEYFKFGYIRSPDGSFVQIGYDADEVHRLTDKYSFQSIVDRIAEKDDNILYALIVDKNYNAIADSDVEDIGIIYNDDEEYKKVLKGEPSFSQGYYNNINNKAFEAAVPLMRGDKIGGIVAVGLSMNYYKNNIFLITIESFIIAIAMLIILGWFQMKNIIVPINLLNKHIKSIDYKSFELHKLPVSENGNFKGLYLTINELLEKIHDSIIKMKNMNEKLLLIMEESGVTLWEINKNTKEVSFPYGSSITSMVGHLKNIDDVVNRLLENNDRAKFLKVYNEYNAGISEKIYCEVPFKDIDGSTKWACIIGKGSVENDKEIVNGVIIDISKYKEQEKQIENLAYNDYLTNLPNRMSFLSKLDKLMNEKKSLAIISLDLNDFKDINDTRGHVFGDKLLMSVSKELVSICDESIYISRFGEDEFLLMVESDNLKIIDKVVNNIISRFDEEFVVLDEEVTVGASLGISLYPNDDDNIEGLLSKADIAMYTAKGKQKNNYVYYSEEMLNNIIEKDEIDKILRNAMKTDGFKLVYQPLINTYSGEIAAFEALIRLNEHTISPEKFIRVAEEKNLINKIGRWVIEEIVSQISKWEKMGLDIKPISVNLSVKQMKDEYLVQYIEDIFSKYHVNPKYIYFEITESLLIEDKDKAKDFMNKLKKIGTKIAIDDFGSGYTSIQYLKIFPVDIIKFDKGLIDEYLNDENKQIINYLIQLAKEFGLEIVAEGVETIEQYKILKDLNCNYIQGYFFSRPLEKSDIENIIDLNYFEKLNIY